MNWCVFYADGTRYEGRGFEPWNIPGLGIIVIVQERGDPQERPYLQHSTDYYIWLGDRWLGCDLFRLWQYWFVEKHDFRKAALAGQTIPNKDFMRIHAQAKELRDKWYDSRNV